MARFGLSCLFIVALHLQLLEHQKNHAAFPFVWPQSVLALDNEKQQWCNLNSVGGGEWKSVKRLQVCYIFGLKITDKSNAILVTGLRLKVDLSY